MTLPANLPTIPGLNDTPSPASPTSGSSTGTTQQLLHRARGPLDSLNQLLDQWLTAHQQQSPMVFGAVHLLVVVTITLLLAWAVGAACRTLGRSLARRGNKLPATLLLIVAPVIRWVMALAGLSDAIDDAWPGVSGPLRWFAGGLFVFSVVLAVRGMTAVARTFLSTLLKPRLGHPPDDELDASGAISEVGSYALVPLIQRIAGVLLWLAGLILVLDHFGQNVSSVVAALGVTSLAIGLASQQALSNIIAGLVLAMDRPFRVGDRIRLPGLDGGEVLETGMRATQIRLSDGSLLIVPNADLVSARMVNQSVGHAVRVEVRLTIPVPLDVDVLTKYLIEAAAKVDPPPLTDRPPRVHLLSISDKLELALILWLPRHADAPRVEEQLRRVALRHIQARLAEIAAAAPVREYSVRSSYPPGSVPAPATPLTPESPSASTEPTESPDPTGTAENKSAANATLLPTIISAGKLPPTPTSENRKRRR